MNATVQQYLDGFEEFICDIAKLCDDWDDIEPDLRVEYREQIEWMLDRSKYIKCEPGSTDAIRLTSFLDIIKLYDNHLLKIGVRFKP